MKTLHYNVVTPQLLSVLKACMHEKLFDPFRLVGGTALSLQRGHRISYDIDLFSDADHGSIDFSEIEKWLTVNFSYVDSNNIKPIGFGKSFFVGNDKNNCVKIDIYYTDHFIDEPLIIDDIRMATEQEIIAMKADVIFRGQYPRPPRPFLLKSASHPFFRLKFVHSWLTSMY